MKDLVVSKLWTDEQIDLIKKTYAKGATNDEFELFLYKCSRHDLDPLKGQIYFVKYGANPGTIVIGLDGFRSRAAKTGKHSGTERGVHRDEKGRVTHGWCKIYRHDWTHAAYEEVAMNEYNTGKAMWAKMPETMIKKVAEVAALRMAFPDQLSELYSAEEMDQGRINVQGESKAKHVQDIIQQEIVDNSVDDLDKALEDKPEYVITFGKFANKKLKEVTPDELANYCEFIESKNPQKPEVLEFLKRAHGYLESL